MNRSRSVSETSVGLFAFLDVLMSTMGSLILVLMIVTPKIRQEAVAKAARAIQKPEMPQSLQLQPARITPQQNTIDPDAGVKRDIAAISKKTDAERQTLTVNEVALVERQQRVGQAAKELGRLNEGLAELRQAKEREVKSIADIQAEETEVKGRLERTEVRLRKIRGEIAKSSTRYALVAYDGVSGTTRQPILIECTKERIKFLQEGISLSSQDIAGFSPSYNPVLSGVRALVGYWSEKSAAGAPKPYVLIIVRPGGTIAYCVVRRLLERMKTPFGYELLTDDQALALPPPTSEEVTSCRTAIDTTLANRDGGSLQALMGGETGALPRFLGRRNQSGLSEPLGGGSIAPRLEPGRTGQPGEGWPDGPQGDTLNPSGKSGNPIGKSGQPEQLKSAGGGSVALSGNSGFAGAPGPQDADGPTAGHAKSLGGSDSPPGLPGSAGSPTDFPAPLIAGSTGEGRISSESSPAAGPAGMPSDGAGQGCPESAAGQAGPVQFGGSRPAADGVTNASQGGEPATDEAPPEVAENGETGSQPAAVQNVQSSGSADSSGDDSPGDAGLLGSGDSSVATPTPRLKHRWGSASPQANIGFERDVNIYVQANRIKIGDQPAIPCGKGETTQSLSRAVVGALDRDAHSWGRPPQGFYWVPSLKFIISPGGNQTYERILPALARHGLSSSVDFRLDTEIWKLPRLVQ